jgi:hypothetical protein
MLEGVQVANWGAAAKGFRVVSSQLIVLEMLLANS